MNYYEHHIGDYDKNTAHLTACEDGIYCRLIRRYYDKERPLDPDVKELQRLVRARSREEKSAVDAVLREFFRLEGDGWHHDKCDAVIEAYKAGEPEREARKKNEDTRLARHRQERAELFTVINGAGLHMAWNTPIAELRNAAGRVRNGDATAPETQPATPPATAPATPATATHTPDTSHQTPELKEGRKRPDPPPACPDGVEAQTWADFLTLRKKKAAPVTETVIDGAKREAAKAGLSLDEFLCVWCFRGSQGLQADWIKPADRARLQDRTDRQLETAALMTGAARATQPARPVQDVIDADTGRLLA